MPPLQDADDELQRRLRALFAEELEDGLAVLRQGLLALEAGADGDVTVQELFRTAHSLKGAAHAATLPAVMVVCDHLESAFARLRDSGRPAEAAEITELLGRTDALGAMGAQLAASEEHTPAPGGGDRDQHAPLRTAVRVAVDKVDGVIEQATEVNLVSQRLHEAAAQAAQIRAHIDRAREHRRAAASGQPARGADPIDAASEQVSDLLRMIESSQRVLQQTATGLLGAAQRLRTESFGDACTSLERVVRDVAAQSGKRARLDLVGSALEIDRSIVEGLRDPLLHLVRNAVDHGLESPSQRRAAGKPEVGVVLVRAELAGSQLTVTVSDDGAGLDLRGLREAAALAGVAMPSGDYELAFAPGVTTRAEVTEVSGRGVGLDAARARIEALGGSLQVSSEPGRGCSFLLTTPLTLAVMRVLLVRAGGQVVALPTAAVERVLQVDPEAVLVVEGTRQLQIAGRTMAAVVLAEALGWHPEAVGAVQETGRTSLVLPRAGEIALVADGLIDEMELAVQPVPVRVAGAHAVLGVAALDGGAAVLVVNPVAVARSAALRTAVATDTPVEGAAATRVLLAEDTVTTRALERSILEAAGYEVIVAVDGAEAWRILQSTEVDVVVSDVDMPEMTGVQLCRRIRSSAALRTLPVVLVTSLDSQEDRQAGLEAGADAYVAKADLHRGTLLDTLARLL